MLLSNPLKFLPAVWAAALALLMILPRISPAEVKEVTLFPNSAKVQETIKVNSASDSEKHPVIIILPSQADPESLIVSPPAGGRQKIDDVRIKSIERVDENKIAQLRAQLKKLQHDKQDMQSRQKALEVQLQFWQAQTKAKTKTVVDADNLSSAIGRNSRKIYAEKFNMENELETINKQIKDLQDTLNQAAGKSEKVWEATILLSGMAPNHAELSYSYTLDGCGWQPLYRLEASPSEKSILFSWHAEIWQSTGKDWKLVHLQLATLQPHQAILPPDLPQWIIKPRTEIVYKSMRRDKSAPAVMNEMVDTPSMVALAAPVETENTTYSLWSLGRKNVPAGHRQRVKIKEEVWPAQFLYLARPSQSPQAFVLAQLKLATPVEIPTGQAAFMIDGAMVGKRNFALAGSEAEIFFGTSPLVTVSSVTTAEKSGTTSYLQSRQTRQWQWRIEAKNAGKNPITLRIEEPIPQARDERIKLTFHHQPKPEEKDSARFVWTLDLPAMQNKLIETGVRLEAPKDMNLDFGWRH
ncbi:MAG: mucoidy inhibitor MuiA family protein [Syntrophaceae bacterium]|nr:mucoidy inhibitor MuiA family protein [Syntrophaceae bacterium]HOC58808.1 mucoidy inhibitor MuiA family protein [Smithellaceae bacterium]HQM45595.1 mucoidy inhibitor MuiA family protein [Smithellaceae bacterium]